MGNPEGKRPPGRPKLRWVDHIKMDLRVIRWGGIDWIGLAQDRDSGRALVNKTKFQEKLTWKTDAYIVR
jgi:hypothetical protein